MLTPSPTNPSCERAFSLIELVIVVVIIGIVAAIAAPRMSGAAGRSREASMTANLAVLNKAAEMYAAEHGGQSVAREPDGTLSSDPSAIARRLTGPTTATGATTGATIFGPYLRAMPANPLTGEKTVRIGTLGSSSSASAGWIFDEAANAFGADSRLEAAGQPVQKGGGGGTAAPPVGADADP